LNKNKDTYKTVQKAATSDIKIKGSQFIGNIFPVHSREEAEAQLNRVRKTYHDATHNCFAYRTGSGVQEISRFSDDGEPSGTAGRPILQVLSTAEVTDAVLVVTRYFGGTKLGTGGLARAYNAVALQTLERAGIKEIVLMDELFLGLPYDLYGLAQNILEKFGGRLGEVTFDAGVLMQVSVRKSQVDSFKTHITEQSNGRIKWRVQP
jgi:uncharacterized YigZ family protein